MKKILTAILILALVATLALCIVGCQPNNTDTPKNSSEPSASATAEPTPKKEFMLTDDMKAKLENMCYSVPDFLNESDLNDSYMRDFLFYSYTGALDTVAGVTQSDASAVVDKDAAEALIKLVLDRDYDVSKLVYTEEYQYCYYKDGKMIVMNSDFGDIEYEFIEENEIKDGVYEVTLNMLTGGKTESLGTRIFEIVPADNSNGFVVIKSSRRVAD